LEEYDLKAYVTSVVVVLIDNDEKKKYKAKQGEAYRLILDGVRDRVVSHLQGKDTSREMWEACLICIKALLNNGRCIWSRICSVI